MDRNLKECLEPGTLSRDGFLGTDPRPPAAIVAADAAELRRLGVAPAAAAGLLAAIARQAEAAQEREVSLYEGRISARLVEGRGRIPCPFGCGECAAKGLLAIRLADGRTLRTSPLGIHLLRAHGFLEGQGAPFRLAPADLQALLQAAAGTPG
ncbi:MAG: hypothetical protein WC789_10025 [Lentisphaeria bacterium]|jgi:hypothetical protein